VPWFPEFISAVELVRRQRRVAGRADPVGQYLTALDRGDARNLAWPVAVVAEIPDDRSVVFRSYLSLRSIDG
jgi:hypothetical protein